MAGFTPSLSVKITTLFLGGLAEDGQVTTDIDFKRDKILLLFLHAHIMPQTFFPILLGLWSLFHLSISGADSKPLVNPDELEWQIHKQINKVRPKYGLPPLDWNEQLIAIARNHSRDMASQHFFSHINLQGEGPSDRALRQGWIQQRQIGPNTMMSGVAENIFQTSLYDTLYTTRQNGIVVKKEYTWKSLHQLVETIVEGWMNSSSHRKIILSSRYDREAIGIFILGTDVYVTQNLF